MLHICWRLDVALQLKYVKKSQWENTFDAGQVTQRYNPDPPVAFHIRQNNLKSKNKLKQAGRW